MIDIPDEIDKSSSVLVNHCKFVRANNLGLAADSKNTFYFSLKHHDIEPNKAKMVI